VKVDANRDLPLATIDPLRIREVFINVLSNALHHTSRGGRVTVALRPHGDRVAVSVTDAGSGIPAEEIPKIFDRFYKGRGSTGTGLGLTIARNLVVAHGGDIGAESQPGVGTAITFTV
jgi:signal transduction histidine kinase